MSYTFLQGLEVVSSEVFCWDTDLFAQLRLNHTVEKSFCSDKGMESCLGSLSGIISEPSMENLGEVLQTLYVEDSPAKTLALLEQEMALMGLNQAFGKKWQGSFVRLCPHTFLWKTHQRSLFEDWTVFSETWPEWGIMQNGECWEHPKLDCHTEEIGYGFLLPTIVSNEGEAVSLNRILRTRETWEKATRLSTRLIGYAFNLKGKQKPPQAKMAVHPIFAEWMMGWVIMWTDLKPLEMAKFQQWRQVHGGF